jgi:hypothetical protein
MSVQGLYVVAAMQSVAAVLRTAKALQLDAAGTVELLTHYHHALRKIRRQGLVERTVIEDAISLAVRQMFDSDGRRA